MSSLDDPAPEVEYIHAPPCFLPQVGHFGFFAPRGFTGIAPDCFATGAGAREGTALRPSISPPVELCSALPRSEPPLRTQT